MWYDIRWFKRSLKPIGQSAAHKPANGVQHEKEDLEKEDQRHCRTQNRNKATAEYSLQSTRHGHHPLAARYMALFRSGHHAEDFLSGRQTLPATIEALVSFSCKSETATKLNKDEAARSIPPIFRLSSLPEKRASRQISVVFDRLEQLASASAEEQEQKRASLDDVLIGLDLEDDADAFIRIFTEDSITETKEILIDSLHRVMGMGVIADEKRENFDNGDPFRPLSIKPETDEPAREATLAAILSMEQAVPIIINPFRNRDQRDLIKKLLNAVMEPNLKYDDDSTKKLRQEAIEAVPVVVKYYTEGDTLVHAGETATIENLALLQAHNTQIQQNRDFSEQAFEVAGNGILLLIGLIAAAVILRTGGGGIVRKIDKLLLLIILSIISLGTAWLLSYLSYHYFALSAELIPYIIPFALVVLLAGILIGENAAIALGFWCSYASAVLLGHSFPVFVLGMMVTVTAASTARNVHRRASLFRAGLWICAVKVIFVLLTFMLTKPPVSTMLWQLGTAVASGVISSVLTILIIPLFEKIFKITTDITLLELSDMGHPLLQKMAMQAPGTYHHSLMVATLAQNAAEAIGANPLLVRVCAYYHDIGKMAKPEFFTENIQHKENPHDELSPHMSALVISSHVKEGLALAKRHKLPQPIFEAI